MKTKAKAKEKTENRVKLWCDDSQEAKNLQMQLQAAGCKLEVIYTASTKPVLNYQGAAFASYFEIRGTFLSGNCIREDQIPYIVLTTCELLSPELEALVGAVNRHTLVEVRLMAGPPGMIESLPMPTASLHFGDSPARRSDHGRAGVALFLARIAYGYESQLYLPKWAYVPK